MRYVSHNHDSNMDVFQGRLHLNGRLVVRWRSIDGRPEPYPDFLFLPDAESRRRLPRIPDEYDRDEIEIYLLARDFGKNAGNDRQNKQAMTRLVRNRFPNIPLRFWTAKHGQISRSAKLDIRQFGFAVECDYRNYYAVVADLHPANGKSEKAAEAGC